jgi:hypothetical protein
MSSDAPRLSRSQMESGGVQPTHATDSLYEEAKRCPRCGQTGVKIGDQPLASKPGAKVESWRCENDLCLTKGEGWIIQINRDGSIPNRQAGPKEFPVAERAMDYGKAIVEQTKHQLNQGEVESGSA